MMNAGDSTQLLELSWCEEKAAQLPELYLANIVGLGVLKKIKIVSLQPIPYHLSVVLSVIFSSSRTNEAFHSSIRIQYSLELESQKS